MGNGRYVDSRSNGVGPGTRLIDGGDGYLYGTARAGGYNEGGVVYKMDYNGSDFRVIHYFDNTAGGMNPYSGVTQSGGVLYGTTALGGEVEEAGTLYSVRMDGSDFKKLPDFGGQDGLRPRGELIVIDGVLYGMTRRGGNSGMGVIYKINIDGSEFAVLHEFSGADGASPWGALTHDGAGTLYGMTSGGGDNGLGVLFKITTEGVFQKLFDFSMDSGGVPNGSLIIRDEIFPSNASSSDARATLEVSIYPNPSTDNFEVYIRSPRPEPIQLIVRDQYGRRLEVLEVSPDTAIQFGGDLKRGLYIIEIMQGKMTAMQRVFKK